MVIKEIQFDKWDFCFVELLYFSWQMWAFKCFKGEVFEINKLIA